MHLRSQNSPPCIYKRAKGLGCLPAYNLLDQVSWYRQRPVSAYWQKCGTNPFLLPGPSRVSDFAGDPTSLARNNIKYRMLVTVTISIN